MLDDLTQMSFQDFGRLMPDLRARRMLRDALAIEPLDEGVYDETSATKKAQMVRHATFCLIDELSMEEREALIALVRFGLKAREEMPGPQPGCDPLTHDVIWLFDTAFRVCPRGYAWTDDAGFDLPKELLEKLESQHT